MTVRSALTKTHRSFAQPGGVRHGAVPRTCGLDGCFGIGSIGARGGAGVVAELFSERSR